MTALNLVQASELLLNITHTTLAQAHRITASNCHWDRSVFSRITVLQLRWAGRIHALQLHGGAVGYAGAYRPGGYSVRVRDDGRALHGGG